MRTGCLVTPRPERAPGFRLLLFGAFRVGVRMGGELALLGDAADDVDFDVDAVFADVRRRVVRVGVCVVHV